MLCKICVKPQGRGALTPPPTIVAANLPGICRGRIYAARQPAATSRFPITAL